MPVRPVPLQNVHPANHTLGSGELQRVITIIPVSEQVQVRVTGPSAPPEPAYQGLEQSPGRQLFIPTSSRPASVEASPHPDMAELLAPEAA